MRNSPTLAVPCPAVRKAASNAIDTIASATITSISVNAVCRSERRRTVAPARQGARTAAGRRPDDVMIRPQGKFYGEEQRRRIRRELETQGILPAHVFHAQARNGHAVRQRALAQQIIVANLRPGAPVGRTPEFVSRIDCAPADRLAGKTGF